MPNPKAEAGPQSRTWPDTVPALGPDKIAAARRGKAGQRSAGRGGAGRGCRVDAFEAKESSARYVGPSARQCTKPMMGDGSAVSWAPGYLPSYAPPKSSRAGERRTRGPYCCCSSPSRRRCVMVSSGGTRRRDTKRWCLRLGLRCRRRRTAELAAELAAELQGGGVCMAWVGVCMRRRRLRVSRSSAPLCDTRAKGLPPPATLVPRLRLRLRLRLRAPATTASCCTDTRPATTAPPAHASSSSTILHCSSGPILAGLYLCSSRLFASACHHFARILS